MNLAAMIDTTAKITLRLLIRGYKSLSWADRLHMIIRWRVCPLPRIAALVPNHGVIVDLGCGHGLFAQLLALQSANRSVVGIELDAHKVALAQQLDFPNLRFVVGDVATTNIPLAEAVTILDVFYLVPHDVQERLLTVCAKLLVSGGVIILKDMAEKPRWKVWLNWLEETLAVRILKITETTESGKFYFRTRDEWKQLFSTLGFSVETVALDHGYYHPHVVFVARKIA